MDRLEWQKEAKKCHLALFLLVHNWFFKFMRVLSIFCPPALKWHQNVVCTKLLIGQHKSHFGVSFICEGNKNWDLCKKLKRNSIKNLHTLRISDENCMFCWTSSLHQWVELNRVKSFNSLEQSDLSEVAKVSSRPANLRLGNLIEWDLFEKNQSREWGNFILGHFNTLFIGNMWYV